MVSRTELVALADLLLTPHIRNNRPRDRSWTGLYKRVLAGLAAEYRRLGKKKFVAVRYERTLDEDGYTRSLALLESFDSKEEAANYLQSAEHDLRTAYVAEHGPPSTSPVAQHDAGHDSFVPKPAKGNRKPSGVRPPKVVLTRIFKLEFESYWHEHTRVCLRVLGPFSDWIVSEQLFDALNCPAQLYSYLAKVGEAEKTKGVKRRKR